VKNWQEFMAQTRDYTPGELVQPVPEITEPPCKHCKLFVPAVKTNAIGEFGGWVFCRSDHMNHDFSCFREKKEPTP